ncbi:MAG TPA: polyketide cyclase [Alteromonas sp.]|nr:polyketide cyclase [Alteromonas sp.]|tara:strand:+ start:318 stop:848 length:531 start_codon:yes stop_codon:yes gene_type:complete
MRGGKWFLNLLIFVFLVGLTGLFLPGEYEVERSVEINAPADKVYAVIVDLRKWEQWSTWYQMDPNAVMTYDGPDRAIGMRVRWRSNILGRGSIQITSLQFNRELVYTLDNPEHGITATGDLKIKPTEDGSELTWISRGSVGLSIIDRYKLLFFDDKLARDIQVGLENIKTLAENSL